MRVPVRVHSRIHACVCEWLFACACRRGDAQLVLLDTQFDPGNEVLRVGTSSPCRILVSVCEILCVNVRVCAYVCVRMRLRLRMRMRVRVSTPAMGARYNA